MSNERTYKTSAIVLRSRNLGEADKIFTLFTQLRGKMDAVAKGVRRTKSHFAGRLEFMTEANLTLHRGRRLDVIVDAEISRSQWNEIVEPDAFATAHLIAEVVDAFCEPDFAMPEIYRLLCGALGALPGVKEPMSIVPRFELRLLHALGLAPPDDRCVRCGGELLSAWTDADAGGLACESCRRGQGPADGLSPADLANFKALGAAKGSPLRPALVATPASARAVDAFVSHHLGKRPKSRAYADGIANSAPKVRLAN